MYYLRFFIALSLACVFSAKGFAQKPLDPGEHFATINGYKTHFFVAGKGPVCLLPSPGWGISVDYLKNSLQVLERFFTVVYYDTRHSGLSSGPEDSSRYTSIDFINDMDALRTYFKQDKMWIAGHSAGAQIALTYGIQHSNYLKGIICIDGIASGDSLWQKKMMDMITKRKGLPYYAKSIDVLMENDTTKRSAVETMNIILPYYFHDYTKANSFNKIADFKFDSQVGRYVARQTYWMQTIFNDLNKISVPVLVIVGDDDFICDPVSQADRITRHLKNGKEVIIKDAGHFSWYEQPRTFYKELKKWLQAHNVKEQHL